MFSWVSAKGKDRFLWSASKYSGAVDTHSHCTQLRGLKTFQLLLLSHTPAVCHQPTARIYCPKGTPAGPHVPPSKQQGTPSPASLSHQKAVWDKLMSLCCKRWRRVCTILSISQVGAERDGTSLTVDEPSVDVKIPVNLLFFWIAYFTRGRVTTLLCYYTYSTLLLQLHSCCTRIYYQSVVGALSTDHISLLLYAVPGQSSPNPEAFMACA